MTLRWHLNMSLMDHVRNIITVVIPFYIHSSPLAVFKRFSVFFYNHRCPTPYTTRGHSGMSLSAPQKDWMINWPWKDSEQWNRTTTGDGASKRAQTPWREREGCRWTGKNILPTKHVSKGGHPPLPLYYYNRQLLLGVHPRSVIYFLLKDIISNTKAPLPSPPTLSSPLFRWL